MKIILKKHFIEIIQKMNEDGISITAEEIAEEFPGTVIGRPHFAAELVKHGVVKK